MLILFLKVTEEKLRTALLKILKEKYGRDSKATAALDLIQTEVALPISPSPPPLYPTLFQSAP